MSIKELVDQILEDRKITRTEQNELNAAMRADDKITKDEEEQIDRVFKLIQDGKIKVV